MPLSTLQLRQASRQAGNFLIINSAYKYMLGQGEEGYSRAKELLLGGGGNLGACLL